MTNLERVEAMIAWLKEHRNKFPQTFKLAPAVTVLDSRKAIERTIAGLQAYLDAKMFSSAFKGEYYNAYAFKSWYTTNQAGELRSVDLTTQTQQYFRKVA